MAREFVESKPNISILILPVDYFFKKSLKRDEVGDTSVMTSSQVDSTALANSIFLKDVSDSAFLEIYINSMFDEFERLGITVYDESHLKTFYLFKHQHIF